MSTETYTPTQQGMVAAFYLTKLGRTPTPNEARICLIEEIGELDYILSKLAYDDEYGRTIIDDTPEETLHELADVLYTAYGYAIARGWNLTEAFERIHAANMTKAIADSGKILRGDAYVPPQLGDLV